MSDNPDFQIFFRHLMDRVEAFNREIVSLPIPERPTMIGLDRANWAYGALVEEATEFLEANCIEDQADALMDLIYFAVGRLIEMGVPPRAVFDDIDRANMGKVQGSLSKRPNSLGHDAIKPPGWQGPDHSWLMHFSMEDVRKLYRFPEPAPVRDMKILVMGYARHGKDTVCEILAQRGYRFTSTSLFCAERIMMPAFERINIAQPYDSVEDCFNDRHNHRAFWFDMISAFNRPDGTALGRAIFEEHDIYCGIRNAREFHALKNAGVFDVAIWVDRSDHLPPEYRSSCTVELWMADFVIDNNGTLEELRINIDQLFNSLDG